MAPEGRDIRFPARAELAINLISRPSGATRELSQRYRARHSEKSVQQNGDADRNVGMVFTARSGPLGSTVHFFEYSAGQDGCIRAGQTILVPRMPSIGDLGRRANPVRTKGVPRAAPGPKMTSISAMPSDCSGTSRAHGAEYSVFCTAQAGVHRDRKEYLHFFMQSATGSMQNAKRKHR